ncbi:MAG: flagellar motor protein MotB [Candidatus Nanopelagicales bacterium]
MATRRKRRSEPEEEHGGSERWLVTYADMITLLMVLFIVMFAISQVDQKKFMALKEGTAAGFGQSTSMLDGASSILDDPGLSALAPIAPPAYQESEAKLEEIEIQRAVAKSERAANERRQAEAAAEVDRLVGVQARLAKALEKAHLRGDVSMSVGGRGLVVSLMSEHVVFDSDLATLTRRGRRVVDTLAPVLRDLPDQLQIDGHTNQLGTRPKHFATDWDLAAARAVTVLRRLNEHGDVPATRLSAASFGQVRPLIDPSKPGSQKRNKRVDITILSELVTSSEDLVTLAAHERSEEES